MPFWGERRFFSRDPARRFFLPAADCAQAYPVIRAAFLLDKISIPD